MRMMWKNLVKDVDNSAITAAAVHATSCFLNQEVLVVGHVRKKELRSTDLALIHGLLHLVDVSEVLFKTLKLKIDIRHRNLLTYLLFRRLPDASLRILELGKEGPPMLEKGYGLPL
jgi:hypothetical protein